jgi:xanthine dehydrogenase accessory factor
MSSPNLFEKIIELQNSSQSFVIITLIDTRGHAPQEVGAKALVTYSGLIHGTVGGGKVEAKAIIVAQELLTQKKSQIIKHSWNLQRDVGMSCGGEVEFIFESYHPHHWKIAVFGAGHIAQELIPLLLKMNCEVSCFDTRLEWLSKFTPHKNLKIFHSPEYTSHIGEIDPDAFCVVMTQGHTTDLPVLKTILNSFSPPYIGVIGSEVKSIKIRNELKTFGIPADRIEKLKCPMGLAIGGNDPAEIAISISAQLLQARDQVFGLKRSWKAPHLE